MFNKKKKAKSSFENCLKEHLATKESSENNNVNNDFKEYEQVLIEKITALLKTKPERFTSRWTYGRNTMNKSIANSDASIQVMIETGQIIAPIEPEMTDAQKKRIIELIQPILLNDIQQITESV